MCWVVLLRLFRDGTLYVRYVESLFDEEEMIHFSRKSNFFLGVVDHFGGSVTTIAPLIDEFVKYVGLEKKIRYPQLEQVVPKLIDEFKLPSKSDVLSLKR